MLVLHRHGADEFRAACRHAAYPCLMNGRSGYCAMVAARTQPAAARPETAAPPGRTGYDPATFATLQSDVS
ncbi:MAG: hypothetical protein ABI439_07495, partial [Rhodospirillales bacterium]